MTQMAVVQKTGLTVIATEREHDQSIEGSCKFIRSLPRSLTGSTTNTPGWWVCWAGAPVITRAAHMLSN